MTDWRSAEGGRGKEPVCTVEQPQCIFERMHFLHGFEDTLCDIIELPEETEELARKLADYQIGIIEEAYRLGKGRIHCYDTTDDWGYPAGTDDFSQEIP